MDVIDRALNEGRTVLTEYESKQVLAAYHIPITREISVVDRNDLKSAISYIGYPLVMKGLGNVAHKTEAGLVKTDIRSDEDAFKAFEDIMLKTGPNGAALVQEMVYGKRELVMGMVKDPQFGPAVMFGLGGIFTEILKDVSFRVAPLDKKDAFEMMKEIRGCRILEAVRGMEAADVDGLADILINLGRIGLDYPQIKEIDINPVILRRGKGVAVDALIILES